MLTKKPSHGSEPAPVEHRSIHDEQPAHRRFAPDVPSLDAKPKHPLEPSHQEQIQTPASAAEAASASVSATVPVRHLLTALVVGTLLGTTITAGGFLAFGQQEQPAIVLHPPPTLAPTPTAAPTATPAPITVFVVGAVQQTGLIELPPGSRVGDAIQLAGGLLTDADAILVNQAAKLSDGAQVYIPFVQPIGEANAAPVEEPPPGISGVLLVAPGDGSSSANAGGLININTASQAELETLSGVGPATAANIIAARPYSSIEDLERATGIGSKTVEKLRDFVTVE